MKPLIPDLQEATNMSDLDYAPDTLLEILVNASNSRTEPSPDGEGIAVVLTVDGQVIAGEIIPNWQWCQEIEEQYRAATVRAGIEVDDEGYGLGIGIAFKKFAEAFIEGRDQYRNAQEVTKDLPDEYQRAVLSTQETQFIHLRNARVHVPGQPGLPGNGMYWRGRLTCVSGWTVGSVSEPTD
jgi:hypothetical protein